MLCSDPNTMKKLSADFDLWKVNEGMPNEQLKLMHKSGLLISLNLNGDLTIETPGKITLDPKGILDLTPIGKNKSEIRIDSERVSLPNKTKETK